MKRIYIFLLFYILLSSILFAQKPHPKRGKIEEAKKTFLKERLAIDSLQSIKFWPIYDEFNSKRINLRKEKRRIRQEQKSPSITNDQLSSNLKQLLSLRVDEANLEKEYLEKFLTVLNPRQVISLIQAEKDFIKLLYKKVNSKEE